MAYSYVQFAGPGAGPWAFTKPFLLKAHVRLYLDLDLITGSFTKLLVEGTDYTWNPAVTQVTANVPAGSTLTIRRETPADMRVVEFTGGSNLTSDDLNNADLQLLYLLQEIVDAGGAAAWLAGAGAPQALLGNLGDYYLDSATGEVYGPKRPGGWGPPIGSIRGPAGPAAVLPQDLGPSSVPTFAGLNVAGFVLDAGTFS